MNVVAIMGRLTRDAELTYTNSGTAMCKFSVAVNERRKQGEEWVDYAHFVDCTLWGKRGESVSRFLTKGTMIGVKGALDHQRWEKGGQKHNKLAVKALDITLTGGAQNEGPREESAPF